MPRLLLAILLFTCIAVGCGPSNQSAKGSGASSRRPERSSGYLVLLLVDLTTYGAMLDGYDPKDKANFDNWDLPQEVFFALFRDVKEPVDIQIVYISSDPVDGPLIKTADTDALTSTRKNAPLMAIEALQGKFHEMREEIGGDASRPVGTDMVRSFRLALSRSAVHQKSHPYKGVGFVVFSDGLIEPDKIGNRTFPQWEEQPEVIDSLEAVSGGCPGAIVWIHPSLDFVKEVQEALPGTQISRLGMMSQLLHRGNITGRERLVFCPPSEEGSKP